jgi:ubiquinone biosynthesis protein
VKSFFRFLLFVYPLLRNVADPVGILTDIESYTLSELDLRNEVKGQKLLRRIAEENRAKFDLARLSFVGIHEALCGENILVADYQDGRTFDELLEKGELSYDTLLELFHIHGFYMFGAGTFHGDIHPGNVILSGDKLFFVDTGSIGIVGDKIRKNLFRFFEALSVWDYDRCAAHLNGMADREIEGPALSGFRKKFCELYADFQDRSVSEVSLTQKMMETIKLGVRSGMVFERGIFPVIRSLMYMDGMVLRCNPDAVLLKDMRRYIAEFRPFV